jgi:hypothetical protein
MSYEEISFLIRKFDKDGNKRFDKVLSFVALFLSFYLKTSVRV